MTIELDSILSSPPGPETWTRLLQTLESSHGEEVLERCDRVLSGWPEEVEREAPLSWVEALLDGADATRLRLCNLLYLEDVRLGGDALRALAGVVAGVTHLSLNDNLIGSVGLERLGRWERASRLKHLSLRGVGADQDGVRALVLTDLSSLERLDLSANRIADEGAEALSAARELGGLEMLQLAQNQITARGVASLARSSSLQSLRLLDLSHNPIGDDGARAIAASTAFPKLQRLFLEGSGVGADGAAALSASVHLPPHIRADWAHSG